MNKIKALLLKFVLIICGILSAVFFAAELNEVQAISILAQSDLGIDTTITRDDVNYNLPKSIVVVPIYPTSNDERFKSDELYKGLYYYTIDKLGFNDIPFHYVVSDSGQIYKGNTGGDERRIKIEGIGDNILVVGYLTSGFVTDFSKQSLPALNDLLIQIANANSIPGDNISFSGIKFIRNQSTKSVSMESASIVGSWGVSLEEIKNSVRANYNPQPRVYKIKAESVEVPTGSVNAGDTVDINIKLLNEGSTGLYGGTDSEIIASKTDGNLSGFYLNDEWSSQTQVSIMGDDEIFLPFQEATFTFKVKVPLYVGDYGETFTLRTMTGQDISVAPFVIKLTINKPDKPIVQINDTETGTLNVRSDASSVAETITQVSPGERFFVTDDAGNGYIQILLNDGSKGWVSIQYLTYISQ